MTQDEYLQQALAYMKQATWDPKKWCEAIKNGYNGQPYNYPATYNYKAQQALWNAAHAGTAPPPPPPPPGVNPRLQNVAIGAWNVMDALAWPKCKIWFSADPAPSLAQFVTAANAKTCRDRGHDVGVWYVPDQVPHSRAVEAAQILGTDLIACDCETLARFNLAVQNGVRVGITNLSALQGDANAMSMMKSGEFGVVNEFYWNQSKRRQPDNHNLPVSSICVAVYNGCSDSQEGDCWEPHIADYKAAGYWWNDMSVYTQNMTAADWAAMPVIP